MSKRRYKLRYRIEPWDGPPEGPTKNTVVPGVKVAEDYGYTDRLFLASIILDADGNAASVLLLDSVDKTSPGREVLELVRDQINHHLEHHTETPGG